MNHYKIIHSKEEILRFGKIVIPSQIDHCVLIYLMGRRKYCTTQAESDIYETGSYLLETLIIPGGVSPDYLYRKLLRLEVPFGSYIGSASDKLIPQNTLAMYCVIVPLSILKAMNDTVNECVNDILNNTLIKNPMNTMFKKLPKAHVPNGIKWMQIDLDLQNDDQLNKSKEVIKHMIDSIIYIVKTRNGYHIVYDKQHKSIDHKKLHEFKLTTKDANSNDYWFSITHQPQTIIPGTIHAGFNAHFVEIDEFFQ